MLPLIPAPWRALLQRETEEPYYALLERFVDAERAAHEVLPAADEVYAALALTPPDAVKVVVLGQDPYPTPGHAHGLAFSVRPGVRLPGSLRNVFRELHDDLGVPMPKGGSLVPWAERGVLLLNAVLTVRAGTPNAHKDRGWERFTDAVLRALAARDDRIVFVLWGAYARKKEPLVDVAPHVVVTGAHPSPLARGKGFFGTRPFSRANAALAEAGRAPVDWALPA